MATPMPSVRLSLPTGRDYMTIMERTKMVYDQLLQEKNNKLLDVLIQKKQERHLFLIELKFNQKQMAILQAKKNDDVINPVEKEFDEQCVALTKKSEAEALEFGIRAQEYLNRMQQESEDELNMLQEDYQAKIDKMADAMECQWRQKHGK